MLRRVFRLLGNKAVLSTQLFLVIETDRVREREREREFQFTRILKAESRNATQRFRGSWSVIDQV